MEKYGSKYFSDNEESITCILCNTDIRVHEERFIRRHCDTQKHKTHLKLLVEKEQIIKLPSTSDALTHKQSQFFKDMCEMFISVNIPFHKVNNPHFKQFIEKYTGKTVPSEATLRKNYLPICYETVLTNI